MGDRFQETGCKRFKLGNTRELDWTGFQHVKPGQPVAKCCVSRTSLRVLLRPSAKI